MHNCFNIILVIKVYENSKVDEAQCSSNALLLHPRGLSSISHGVDSFLIVDQCSLVNKLKLVKGAIQYPQILLSKYNSSSIKLRVRRDF